MLIVVGVSCCMLVIFMQVLTTGEERANSLQSITRYYVVSVLKGFFLPLGA